MKNITNDLKSVFENETTNIVKCWKITFKDDTNLAFTTNDENFLYKNVLYNSLSANDVDNIKSNIDIKEDNFEIINIISSNLINKNDILNGKYDSAKVEIFLLDTQNLDKGKVVLLSGKISNIELKDDIFTVKVAGLKDEINKTIGEKYSPLCRCNFCDSKCKLNKNNFTFSGTITNIIDEVSFITNNEIILSKSSGYFDYGIIEFTSGNNIGQKMEIKQYNNGQFILQLNLPKNLAIGDTFNVIAGCNKEFSTCCDKFNNAINFHGEPHLPGMNILLKVK